MNAPATEQHESPDPVQAHADDRAAGYWFQLAGIDLWSALPDEIEDKLEAAKQ